MVQGTTPTRTEKENIDTVGDFLSFAINDAKQVLYVSVSTQPKCFSSWKLEKSRIYHKIFGGIGKCSETGVISKSDSALLSSTKINLER